MNEDKYDFRSQLGPDAMAAGLHLTRALAVHQQLEDIALFQCTVVGLQTGDTVFRQPRCVDCTFESPNFTATTFVGGYFRNVRFIGASFRSTVFDRCVLEECDFGWEEELPQANEVQFVRCVFSNATTTEEKCLRRASLATEDCRFLTEKKATVSGMVPHEAKALSPLIAPPPKTVAPSAAEPGRFAHLER